MSFKNIEKQLKDIKNSLDTVTFLIACNFPLL